MPKEEPYSMSRIERKKSLTITFLLKSRKLKAGKELFTVICIFHNSELKNPDNIADEHKLILDKNYFLEIIK